MKLLSKNKVVLVAFSAVLVSCQGGKDKTNIELMRGMFDQTSIKAQDWDPSKADNSTGRIPPDGTVPRGFKPYKYGIYEADAAEAGLKNPIAGRMDAEILSRGKAKYDLYCALCHGANGDGNGHKEIIDKMILKPPSLKSETVKNWKDGRIFHLLSQGRGLMGGYSRQIRDENDRWAVVNYIRSLQK